MDTITNFIDGAFVEPRRGGYLDNVEPATGQVYSRLADGDAGDVGRAVDAAAAAFGPWSRAPARERSRLLLRIADLIESRVDELAVAESKDGGKPVSLARRFEIPRAAANFRFFATAILHEQWACHAMDHAALNYTLRRPHGVVGLISPWNLPLYLLSWKIAPALATGNTVVAKPSELTPMTARMLCDICRDAGLPPGVLNVVHGHGASAGAALVAHERVSAISFTGGTRTGAEIARTAAPMFKRLSLELGGKNPNLVFADADLDRAIEESVRCAFQNQGQICLCGSRVFVEHSAYPEFLERFVARARALRVADPSDKATEQGALVSEAHLRKVESYVDMACREGGRIECGGRRPEPVSDRCRDGFFHEPTVITNLSPQCHVNQEEVFGPVVSVMPFTDETRVIEDANATAYGLSATIWTRDVARAHRVADALNAGTVWINCWLLRDLRVPFGGMGASGVGREGGKDALRFFTEPKNICVRVNEETGSS